MALSDEEVERIADAMAPKLVSQVKSQHHDFWIDPETHYQQHQWMHEMKEAIPPAQMYDLKNLVSLYRMTRSLWLKAFLGFAIVSTAVVTGLAAFFHR